jgi:hypothetical protein
MKSLSRPLLPDTPLLFGGLRFSTGVTPWFTRVQVRLNDQMVSHSSVLFGTQLKFDSGLLIKSSDLQVNLGP